ncbi:hypothetical protein PGRAN_02720 [Listeria grandensis FSL F6-0971]|uniref:DUF2634 domain-containing protein n=1 Tax=Listeria grandensis FSL F6-0971 TaxID=1265819 RepID=W7BP19_9LIST|nr:DUF2634 domain-containing protein [Listeria grandensis]EUJ24771.1 hypothetical protein PGRAN_02720 [Listeria grandensis FSL F6-0971]
MKDLLIKNGDLVFTGTDFRLVKGSEQLRQNVESILKTSEGEYVLDEDLGLNRENILGKGFDEELARTDIVEAIGQEQRIEEVSQIDFEKNGRELKINLKMIEMDEEELELEVDLDA